MSPELLFEDYKVKVEYVRHQYDRLWERFNYFLGVQLALFGFLGYLTFNLDIEDPARLPAAAGLLVSALWYVVGAQDRRLVEVYRSRADAAAVRFAEDPQGRPGFDIDHASADIPSSWRSLRSWYWQPISITKMPATFGLLLFGIWLLILIGWRPLLGR